MLKRTKDNFERNKLMDIGIIQEYIKIKDIKSLINFDNGIDIKGSDETTNYFNKYVCQGGERTENSLNKNSTTMVRSNQTIIFS